MLYHVRSFCSCEPDYNYAGILINISEYKVQLRKETYVIIYFLFYLTDAVRYYATLFKACSRWKNYTESRANKA